MKNRLLSNFLRNHEWFEIGLESIWVAIFLEYTQSPFTYPRIDPIGHFTQHIGDQYVPVVFSVVGAYCIVMALFDLKIMHAQQIGIFSTMFCFIVLLSAFIERDIDTGSLSWMTGFLVVIVIRIFVNAVINSMQISFCEDMNEKLRKRGAKY